MVAAVQAPIGREQIHPSVLVEISRRDRVPPSGEWGEAELIGRLTKRATFIEKDAQRSPFDREDQVRVTVAGEIGKERAGDQTDSGECGACDFIEDELTIAEAENP